MYIHLITSIFVMVTAPWQWVLPRQRWHGNHWSFEQKALGHTSQRGCEKSTWRQFPIEMLDARPRAGQSDIGRIWLEVYKVQILILQGQHMASPLPWKLQDNLEMIHLRFFWDYWIFWFKRLFFTTILCSLWKTTSLKTKISASDLSTES